MCIPRATVSAVSCLVVPAFICIDLLISRVLKINDDDDDDDVARSVFCLFLRYLCCNHHHHHHHHHDQSHDDGCVDMTGYRFKH